ncbi:hypothetical protein HOD20_04410 [archaeon]|jgi:hypothetical protein|nr:hypothetical protein [archaeon]MBT4351748.1 hypothetical protein [archaeon]MBT4647853.1 hypothetical protein [archaeon]MBT6821054.1 hypothetical protein [archaeon]MBT7392027.1 hypothetical protein [archaeon]
MKKKQKQKKLRLYLLVLISIISLLIALKHLDSILIILICILVTGINTFLAFLSSKIRGLNLEVFGLSCALILFTNKTIKLIFLVKLLISYVVFQGFDIWAFPYLFGTILTYILFSFISLPFTLNILIIIIIVNNLITYLFFALIHGNPLRPIKDTVISTFLNFIVMQIVTLLLFF